MQSFQNTDINSELDELDREEFYRLKKVQDKKQKETARTDAEAKARRIAEAEALANPSEEIKEVSALASGNEEPADIIAQNEDDIIF